jgi:hypothetical protein
MPRHATRTSFKPGHSGNPNGRPRTELALRDLARGHGPAVITRLAELSGIVRPAPPADSQAVQVMAVRELLGRGYGKSNTTACQRRQSAAGGGFQMAEFRL